MRNLKNRIKNKQVDEKKLIEYGFIKQKNSYTITTNIFDNQFKMIVTFSNNELESKLIDIANDEEYVLVDIEDSTGEFVGRVREAYDDKIQDIIEKCTNPNVFKYQQSKEVISYIKEKYGNGLEFLWEKYDNCAIWRNKTNNKWYGALLTISEKKLNPKSDREIEIIDLRYSKEEISNIIDNKKVFPGYHMNKKSWITIILDGSVNTEEIYKFIDNSYNIVKANKNGKTESEHAKKVYKYLTTIPKGKVVTYKQVAEHLGNKGLARVVGNILHKNPDGDKYPCYKVLNSKGELAESFVFGGKNIQKERLEKDGIKVENDKVDLNKYQWKEKNY